MLRKLYYKVFKRYRRIEMKMFSWQEADILIRQNEGRPEDQQWGIAEEEDKNHMIGFVFLERKERIK